MAKKFGIPLGGSFGHKVPRKTFYECIDKVIHGEITIKEAAKRCNISKPTFMKWAAKAFMGETVPEEFFQVEVDSGVKETD